MQAQQLYDLLILIFNDSGKLADLDALKNKSGISDQAWSDLLQYTSQVMACCCYNPVYLSSNKLLSGFEQSRKLYSLAHTKANSLTAYQVNYRSFGFTKIIPRTSEADFARVVESSVNAANATPLWKEVSSAASY
jgi:dipeptidyl-peptidase III